MALAREAVTQLTTAAQGGDEAATEALLAAHEGLVRYCVQRWLPMAETLDFDDLAQEGRLGLLQAVRTFDPTRGTAFSGFAKVAINFAIRGALRHDPVIHRPAHRRNDPTLARANVSLDEHVRDDEGSSRLGETLRCDGPSVEEEFLARLSEALVRQALPRLDPELQEALTLRYGLDGCEPRSYPAMGRTLGVAPNTARKREAVALATLRELLDVDAE